MSSLDLHMCDGIFSTSDASEYRSVKVVDTYAYIVSEDAGHGMQVRIASRMEGEYLWHDGNVYQLNSLIISFNRR